MKFRHWNLALAGIATALLAGAVVMAQEKKPDGAKPEAKPAAKPDAGKSDGGKPAMGDKKPGEGGTGADQMAEAMKRWEEFATTGENHKKLESMIGKWNLEVKHMMPGMPEAETMKCTADVQWILDKHFVEERVTGPAEAPGMPPFEGLGIMGYDNSKKEYVGIFIHSMTTGFQVSHGPASADPNHRTFEAEAYDALTGKTGKMRCMVDVIDNNKHVYTQYATGPDGKEYKELEITYTRAGAAAAAPAGGAK